MRYQGRITTWKDGQGFGFITPNGGGKEVFIHIKAFTKSKRRPVGNELVTYEVAADAKGKLCAQQVWYVGASSDKPLRITKSVYPVYFAVAFLTLMGIAAALDTLPLFVFVIYCVASLLTFSLYWSISGLLKTTHKERLKTHSNY